MAPVETEFYDLLGVPTDVNDTDLKKAYRKQAMKYHPDKNKSPGAEEMFKEMSKAYQVLSDPNLRAVYDKQGKKMMEDKGQGVTMEDATTFFGQVFGGDRFNDYIGEISIMKEMTSVASAMMTEEEKAELEKELSAQNSGSGTPNAPPTPGITETAHQHPPSSPVPEQTRTPEGETHVTTPSNGQVKVDVKGEKEKDKKGRKALSPEQKKKLEDLEKERQKNREERVEALTKKLIERLRPYVEAKQPGGENDPETKAFQEKMKREADDLKLESFGVELLHTIGSVYGMKATSFLKSKKFLGIPGFFSRMKERGALAKDAWGVIGSALSVQTAMNDMVRLQEKGEIPEEDLRALEQDISSHILLASWRGTRFEVIQVLREVCDKVLKEPGVSNEVLMHRANGLLMIGLIYKSTVPDESAEERRELERMVADAASGRSRRARKEKEKGKAKEKKVEGAKDVTGASSPKASAHPDTSGPAS